MTARIALKLLLIAVLCTALNSLADSVHYFPVPKGTHPHDVAASPEANGVVYYTAQHTGKIGLLYPTSGKTEEFPLGEGSAPHGVIIGPDKAPWITDSGLNAIVRFDPRSRSVKSWPLPKEASDANLNTATFDNKGRLWFTGQNGVYGRLDPATSEMKVWKSPRGRGPYGITTTPAGDVFYASLAGNHIARIDIESGEATVIEPPTKEQGARRVWSDSKGNLWVSYWNTGHVGKYNPATRTWHEWKMAGNARMYAVWVDERDKVWLTDFESNAIVRFDPATDRFKRFPSNQKDAAVRQLAGRRGEVWGAESGNDRLVRITVK